MSGLDDKRVIARFLVVIMLVSIAAVGMGPVQVNALSAGKTTALISADNGAVLRKSPSTTAEEINTIAHNEQVEIIRELFTKADSAKSTSIWYYVSVSGQKGYIRSDLIGSVSYNPVTAVTTAELNYRVGPGIKMTKKGSFEEGTSLQILVQAKVKGNSQAWYKIKKGSSYYYVSGAYLRDADETESESDNIALAAATTESEKLKDSFSGPVTFELTDLEYPTVTYTYVPFGLRGKVTCSWPIEKVRIGIMKGSKWVIKVEKDVKNTAFNIKSVDNSIKFGDLAKGNYKYVGKFYVKGKWYKKINYKFTVKKGVGGSKITKKALAIAWPAGTAVSKYKFKGGKPTAAFKKVFDEVYPTHNKWGKGPKTGCCCDVFVGTVIRASGFDPDMPRGETEMWSYFPKSEKWARVSYTGKESELRSGDVILYKRKDGGQHVLLYVKNNGKGVIAEAAYQKYYGHINTSLSKIQKWSNKKKMVVYRPAQ